MRSREVIGYRDKPPRSLAGLLDIAESAHIWTMLLRYR